MNRPFLSNFTTRWLMYPSDTKMLPWGSQPTSVGRANRYRSSAAGRPAEFDDGLDGLGASAQHHQDLAFGVELDDHVRPLVDGPDVVFGVDAHLVRELEPVDSLRPIRERTSRSRRTRTDACRLCGGTPRDCLWSSAPLPCSRRDTHPAASAGSSERIQTGFRERFPPWLGTEPIRLPSPTSRGPLRAGRHAQIASCKILRAPP